MVVAVVVAGGCGGGTATESDTTTAGRASSAPSTAVESKTRLEQFLAALKPYREQAIRSSDRVNAAIDQYTTGSKTTASLSALGDTFDAEANAVSGIVDGMARITPPASLADEYADYLVFGLALASKLAAMADDAHAGISAVATREEVEQLDATGVSHFRHALIEQLSANGVTVPSWVHQLGG